MTIFDKKDGEYGMYVEIANLTQSKPKQAQNQAQQQGNEQGQGGEEGNADDAEESSGSFAYHYLEYKGQTLSEARLGIRTEGDRPFYLGTNRVVVLTMDAAIAGIDEYLARIREDRQYRKTVRVVTTRTLPRNLITTQTENDESIGSSIEDTYEASINMGETIDVIAGTLFEYLAADHACFLLPNMDVKNHDILLTGYTVIHKNRAIGFIKNDEARGVVHIRQPHSKFLYDVPLGENLVVVDVKQVKQHFVPTYKDDKLHFTLNFTFDPFVQYINHNVPLDDKALATLSKTLQQMIKQEIEAALFASAKTFNCDYLKLVDVLRIYYPKEHDEIEFIFEKLLATATFSVNVTINPMGIDNAMDYDPPMPD